jgi:hypothetical protein
MFREYISVILGAVADDDSAVRLETLKAIDRGSVFCGEDV